MQLVSKSDLFAASQEAHDLLTQSKSLLGLYVLQYSHLIQNSPRGYDCVYAEAARKWFTIERQKEIDSIEKIHEVSGRLLSTLKAIELEKTDEDPDSI